MRMATAEKPHTKESRAVGQEDGVTICAVAAWIYVEEVERYLADLMLGWTGDEDGIRGRCRRGGGRWGLMVLAPRGSS